MSTSVICCVTVVPVYHSTTVTSTIFFTGPGQGPGTHIFRRNTATEAHGMRLCLSESADYLVSMESGSVHLVCKCRDGNILQDIIDPAHGRMFFKIFSCSGIFPDLFIHFCHLFFHVNGID